MPQAQRRALADVRQRKREALVAELAPAGAAAAQVEGSGVEAGPRNAPLCELRVGRCDEAALERAEGLVTGGGR